MRIWPTPISRLGGVIFPVDNLCGVIILDTRGRNFAGEYPNLFGRSRAVFKIQFGKQAEFIDRPRNKATNARTDGITAFDVNAYRTLWFQQMV